MDHLFTKLSLQLGGNVSPDHLKLAFSILSTYPCAVLFKHLNSTNVKHVFSILYTTFIMLSVLKLYDGFIHIAAISTISYLLMKYCRHHPKIAWINFTLVMASMAVCHIGRQFKGFEGDTELDYSGALMIITIKLSSYGFNVLDGLPANQNKLSSHTQKMCIVTYPTVLEYYGWVFFFAGFLAGPTCEYMDYIRFISSPEKEYSSKLPALKRLGKSLIFVVFLIFLAPKFNYFEALKPAWKAHSFWYKILFIQLSAFLTRCKYYFIWYLSEGASILSGFGFNGVIDGEAQWDKLNNVNVLDCELAQSYKQLSENWNIGANHWLRHYVYLRFNPPGSTSTTLKTYIVSSMWHGFHPGFYIFFMTASLLQLIARQVRRTIRPFFLTADQKPKKIKRVYDVCTWIASMGLLNMLVPCFDLLHIPLILQVWREIYYCHYIVIALGGVIFYTAKPYLIQLQKKKLQ
ncbi:Lysophospholipid acyltransferase [Mucor circinelloides]